MTSRKCQWRDCEDDGHRHFNVHLTKIDAYMGTVLLCKKHCRQARLTQHMDIMFVQIQLLERATSQ